MSLVRYVAGRVHHHVPGMGDNLHLQAAGRPTLGCPRLEGRVDMF